MFRRSGSCGLLARLLAGMALVAVLAAPTAQAGKLGLEIVDGPSGTVATRTATFTFRAKDESLFFCSLDQEELEQCEEGSVTYNGLADGSHTFRVVAQLVTDDAVTDSASRRWTVLVPPDTRIDGGPSGTVQTTEAVFTFSAIPAVGSFECSLDGAAFARCASPKSLTDLERTSHTFAVRAVSHTGRDPTPAQAEWQIEPLTPPAADTRLVSTPAATVTSQVATFVFESDPLGAAFECSLDGAAYVPCTTPFTTSSLDQGAHRFAVRAVTAAGRDQTPAAARWTIALRDPPETILVRAPSGTTEAGTADIAFRSSARDARFECAFDDSPFASCVSPHRLEGIGAGVHRFRVRARNADGVDTTPAEVRWSVVTASSGGGGGWQLPTAITVIVVLGSIALSVTARLRLRARRLEWQLQAADEAPQGPCSGGRACQKELTLKPARRTIAHLDLEASDDSGHRLQSRVEGRLVDELNAAVRRYRREHSVSADLRAALFPVAKALVTEVEIWLAQEDAARRDIAVRARLEGGKAECVFTLWRCVRGQWRKGRSWKIELEDVRDEPVAAASHPYPAAVAAEVLLSQLGSFVTEVDVVAPQPLPERAPVLHG